MSVRKGGVEIATLGPGAVVGEAAIVNHTLRSATVVALTPLKVVHFTRERIEELVEQVPAFGAALRAAAAGRSSREADPLGEEATDGPGLDVPADVAGPWRPSCSARSPA